MGSARQNSSSGSRGAGLSRTDTFKEIARLTALVETLEPEFHRLHEAADRYPRVTHFACLAEYIRGLMMGAERRLAEIGALSAMHSRFADIASTRRGRKKWIRFLIESLQCELKDLEALERK